jgi:cytochrome c oxidase assembly factor CtaG
MLSTFFLAGLLFWLQFIPSRPFAPRLTAFGQISAVVVSNVVMTIIAISISFLTTHSLYTFGGAAMGMSMGTAPHVTLSPYADQQIGAAILWVCGDFWAFPILIIAVRRLMREDRGLGGFNRRTPGQAPITSFRGVEFGHKS